MCRSSTGGGGESEISLRPPGPRREKDDWGRDAEKGLFCFLCLLIFPSARTTWKKGEPMLARVSEWVLQRATS